MSPRDSDLVKLAGLCGWRLDVYERLFGGFPPGVRFLIPRTAPESSGVYSLPIPAPDAPLPEALAFVGRIAEAVGYERDGLTIQFRIGPSGNPLPEAWRVTLGLESDAAPDLAWAACRAAIAARKGGTDAS